jgi:hypothetical protein
MHVLTHAAASGAAGRTAFTTIMKSDPKAILIKPNNIVH